MASDTSDPDSLYPIAVLIDELRNDDVQVCVEAKENDLINDSEMQFLVNSYD